jgi:DNA-binding transcriptional MerR regulator
MKQQLSRFVKDDPPETPGGLSIGALAARSGVPVETIRIWERRHGVPRSLRSTGGHRRYREADVERVRWLADRVAAGQRIGAAAAALRLLDPPDDAPSHARVVEAALAGDQSAVEREVDGALGALELVDALEAVVFPALAELGGRWADGRPAIAAEHLLSEVVAARLSRRMAEARRDGGPVAVVFCPGGERHALGAMALCVVLSQAGWRVTFLGADLPAPEATALAAGLGARLLVAVCTLPRTHAPLVPGDVPPGVTAALAGPGAPAGGGCTVLGPSLADARARASELRAAHP